ncbi:hypothetical protein J4122_001095 [Salmonella enterica]|nr:hypothetical protein [Salmonella enterica]
MKKYTLPLSGLAISLGMISSAMAAPVTGTQTITGKLTAPTCTVSVPVDFKIPDLTVTRMNSVGFNTNVPSHTGVRIGAINVQNCENVQATAKSTEGTDAQGPGNGRFKYANVIKVDPAQEPLLYHLTRKPKNMTPGDGSWKGFNLTGAAPLSVGDGDELYLDLVRGRAPKPIDSHYLGNYSANVTFTFNYS